MEPSVTPPTQDLNLVDKLILLAIDDEKGNFVSNSMVFCFCQAGAILFELSMKKRVTIVDSTVKVVNSEKLNEPALDHCLELIAKSKKDRKMRYWLEVIGEKGSSLRKMTVSKLVSLGILTEKENKFLWVFKLKNYPTKNEVPEQTLRQRLHDIVLHKAKTEDDLVMLISLVDACGLNKEVYGKEMAKEKAAEIKKIIKEYQFADATGKQIKELHEVIIAMLVVLITTSTVLTNS